MNTELHRHFCFPAIAQAIVTSAILVPSSSAVAEWNYNYNVLLQSGYDSNLRLTPTDPVESVRSQAGVSAILDRQTDRYGINASADVRALDNNEIDLADNANHYLNLNLRSSGSRLSAFVAASSSSVNTLSTAVDDTGVVDLDVRRERDGLRAGIDWFASERVTYSLSGNDESVEYPGSRSFVDYDFQAVQLSRSSRLGEKSQLAISASYSELDSPSVLSFSETIGVNIGLDWQPTETTLIRASAGRFRTDTERTFIFIVFPIVQTDSDEGWTADLSLTKRWQYTTLEASVAQSVQPSGSGFLNKTLDLEIDLEQRLSETFTIGFNARRSRFDSVGTLDRLPNDRDFGRVALRFEYRATERLSVALEASHAAQVLDRLDDVGRKDNVYLTFRYRGGRR